MSNPKQRNIYFLSIGAAIVLVVGGIYVASKGNAPQANAGAAVAEVPQVSAVPGSSTNGQYNKDVQSTNIQKADQALQNDGSFVPKLTNNQAITDVSPMDEIERQRKAAEAAAKLEQDRIAAEQEAARIAEERARQTTPPVMPVTTTTMPVQQQVAVRAKTEKYSAEDALLIATLSGASHARSTNAEFDFARQKPNKEMSVSNVQGDTVNQSNSNAAVASEPAPYAKAGTVFNAILESGINSDEPSPVLAKIVSGEMKGTRLIGQIQTVGKKVVIQFSTANIPGVNSSVKIGAFAVDPNTSRTALADNVDNHYFLKYGVLLASSFVSGMAEAIRQNNSTSFYDPETKTNITIPNGTLTTRDINRQALGEVGKTLATDAQQRATTLKPTITVNSGSAIGILLVDDLVIKN